MTRQLVLGMLIVATTIACGGSSAAAPTPPPAQASITLTVSPNPATSTVCSPACVATNGNAYQFRAAGTLTIQETGGISVNIDSIVSGSLTYTAADVTQRSGTSRVAAKGSLLFPLAFLYGLDGNPNASRSVVFPIVVSFTDDRGIHGTAAVQWAAN